MGQSSPSPSRVFALKSSGPKRREIRPQWFVRPPTILARHHMNSVPSAFVNGSPSRSHPPTAGSNSANGRSFVDAPRRGDSYGILSMAESRVLSHGPPASRRRTFAPARVRTYAAIPPPAPEPTMQTSYVLRCEGRTKLIDYPPLRTRESKAGARTPLVQTDVIFVCSRRAVPHRFWERNQGLGRYMSRDVRPFRTV